jgi:hypothetical protein
VGRTPTSIAVGDFDGDGVSDLATANIADNTVSVLHGNGDGRFAAPMNLVVGSKPVSITSGDFNGDGNSRFSRSQQR